MRHFIGFANFYRQFIENFSKVALPSTNSTPLPANEWRRTPEIEAAQKKPVELFTTAPVLKHLDPDRHTVVEAIGSYLCDKVHRIESSECFWGDNGER